MTKTKDDFNRMKAKVTYAKGQIRIKIEKISSLCVKLKAITERGEGKFEPSTAKKLALEIEKSRKSLESKTDNLESAGDNLIDVILEMNAKDTPLESLELMMTQVNQEIKEYSDKTNDLKETHEKILELADTLLASPKKQAKNQINNETNLTNEFERFIAQTDLKPTFLNQDTNMVELNRWCTQLSNYINAGYRGSPPEKGVFMHLPPLMHPSRITDDTFNKQSSKFRFMDE